MIEVCYKKTPCCGCPDCDTCTKQKEEMLFNELFSKYGSASEYAEKTLHIFQIHPDKLENTSEVLKAFERADKDLERLEHLVAMLNIYKMRLTHRFNYLETAPTKQKIKLERYRQYKGKVFYYIKFFVVNLDSGSESETISKQLTFKGTEKKQAISKFEELKKEYKNAIFEIDIQKKYWEK